MFCRWAVWPTGLLFLIILQLVYFVFAKAHQDHVKLLNIGHKRSIRAKRTVFHFFFLYTYICIHYLHQWKSRWSCSLLLVQIYSISSLQKLCFVSLFIKWSMHCLKIWSCYGILEHHNTFSPFFFFIILPTQEIGCLSLWNWVVNVIKFSFLRNI